MELSKKTTVLFPPQLHKHLVRIARQRRTSLGELVRTACEAQYGAVSDRDARMRAVDGLRRLSLPVGSTAKMKSESVPDARTLLP